MATTLLASAGVEAVRLRPEARWVSTIDERGRARLVMAWHVPDADEALRTVVGPAD